MLFNNYSETLYQPVCVCIDFCSTLTSPVDLLVCCLAFGFIVLVC